ncbi:MAG: DUF2007 domain-containing protein [Bacteroidota bacterium]
MSLSDELKRVFVGSKVEGLFLKEMLKESGIGYMEREAFQSSIQAGWADGLPEDTIRLFVDADNYDKAKKLIDEYFAERYASK